MNICVFCHDAYMSGANRSLYDWISEDTDDKFLIILPHQKSNQIFDKLENCKVVSGYYFCTHRDLGLKPFNIRLKKFIKNMYMSIFNNVILKRLKKIINQNDCDIIITNSFANIYGAIIAQNSNIPHFWHIREFMEKDHEITHLDSKLVRKLTRDSNAIYISDVIKNYYHNKFQFKNETIIYNKIAITTNFNKDKQLFDNNLIKIMISGTLQKNKGQKEAILAVSKLIKNGINVYLDIFGDGPQKKELREMINKLGIEDRVKLQGYSNNLLVDRENYDIALVCSSNEALGRVTVESMGSGCITIGADSGFTSYLIKDGYNGFLYQLHNTDNLAEKILYVIENKNEMQQIRINARQYVETVFTRPIYKEIIQYIKYCTKIKIEGDNYR